MQFLNPSPIPIDIQKWMIKSGTFPISHLSEEGVLDERTPIPISHLSLLELKIHENNAFRMIVHKDIYEILINIFKTIINEIDPEEFLIEKMELIEAFNGNDDESMKANNSSAFNVRPITGRIGVYSKHSYGLAIDINPLYNPYRNGDLILPPEGKSNIQYFYADSDKRDSLQTKFHITDKISSLFKEKGFDWGGDWKGLKQDFHHFELIPPNYENIIKWNISMQEYDCWFQRNIRNQNSDTCYELMSFRGPGTFKIVGKDGVIKSSLEIDIEELGIYSISSNKVIKLFENLETDSNENINEFEKNYVKELSAYYLKEFSNETSLRFFGDNLKMNFKSQFESYQLNQIQQWNNHNPYALLAIINNSKIVGFISLELYSNLKSSSIDNSNENVIDSVLLNICIESNFPEDLFKKIVIFICKEYVYWLKFFYPLTNHFRLNSIILPKSFGVYLKDTGIQMIALDNEYITFKVTPPLAH